MQTELKVYLFKKFENKRVYMVYQISKVQFLFMSECVKSENPLMKTIRAKRDTAFEIRIKKMENHVIRGN